MYQPQVHQDPLGQLPRFVDLDVPKTLSIAFVTATTWKKEQLDAADYGVFWSQALNPLEIAAGQSHSARIAEAEDKNKIKKEPAEVVPPQFHEYLSVFSKKRIPSPASLETIRSQNRSPPWKNTSVQENLCHVPSRIRRTPRVPRREPR